MIHHKKEEMAAKNIMLLLILLSFGACNQKISLEGAYTDNNGLVELVLNGSEYFSYAEEQAGHSLKGQGKYWLRGSKTLVLDYSNFLELDSSFISPLLVQADPNQFQFRIIDMVDSADMSFTGLLKVIEGVSDEFLPSRDSEKTLIVPINQLTKVSKLEFSFLGYYPLIISLAELQEFGTNSFLVSMKPDNIEVISESSIVKYRIEITGTEIRLVNKSRTLVKTNKD